MMKLTTTYADKKSNTSTIYSIGEVYAILLGV